MGKVGEFFAGAALFAGGAFLTGASFGLASPLGTAMMATGLSIAGNALGAIIAGRPNNKQAQQANFNPEATARVVYGRASVGASIGADIWVDHDDISDHQSLWTFAGFCLGSEDGSGVEDVEKIWLDDILAIDPVTTGAQTNTRSGVEDFYDEEELLTYSVRRGTRSQGVNTDAQSAASNASDRYPDDFRGRRICYMAANLWKHKDRFPHFPRSIRALVKGNRVYDPRNPNDGPNNDGWIWDSADTSASLNQNPGRNPALILLDYLTSDTYGAETFYPERDGGDTSLSEIDEQSFIDAANYCDELVDDGSGGTQPRYSFNGWIDTGNSIPDNINAIKSAMRAELVMQGGKFRVVIPQVQSSVMTLTEDDIIGDWRIRRGGSTSVPNRVVALIPTNDGENSTEVQFPDVDDTTFLDQDNGNPQIRTIKLYGVNDPYRARQISMVTLKENREDTEVQFVAKERVAELEVGDVFTLDHAFPGWQGASSKDFRVTKLEIRMDFRIRVTATEYAESAYDLSTLSTRATPPPGSDLPDPTTTDAPTNLSLTSDSTTQTQTPAGDKTVGILATWDLPTDEGIDRVVVLEREDGTSDWNTADVVDPGDTQRSLFRPEGGEDGDTWEVGVYVVVGQRQRKSTITTTTVTLSTDFVATDTLQGVVNEDLQESDFDTDGVTEGRLTLEVVADSGTYDVQFDTRQGRGTGWTTASNPTGLTTGSTTSQDVELTEGKLSFIRYEVFVGGTSDSLGRRVVQFDPDNIAQVTSLNISVDPDTGALSAEAAGDSDTGSIWFTHTLDGTEPSTPTTGNASESLDGRSGSETFSGVTVPKGATARVKALGSKVSEGSTTDSDLAPADTAKSDSQKRQTPSSTVNLLGEDAGPEHSGTSSSFHEYAGFRSADPVASRIPLEALALEAGEDTISIAADLKSATGADSVRFQVSFRDDSNTILATTNTAAVTSSTYVREAAEDISVPSGATNMVIRAQNNDTTEQASVRRAMVNRGPVVAPYTDPPTLESENLLGVDALPERSGTADGYAHKYLDAVSISDLGLEVGDVLSFSADVKSDGTRGVDIRLEARDSSDTLIKAFGSNNFITSTAYERHFIHSAVLPENTALLTVGIDNENATSGTGFGKRAMLNRGPRAAPFSIPKFAFDRDQLPDLPNSKFTEGGDAVQDFQIGGFPFNSHSEPRTGQDGDQKSFNADYASGPEVNVWPKKARTYLSGQSGEDQRSRMTATNVSTSGFDLVGVVQYGTTTTTSHDDGFSSSRNTAAPESGSASTSTDGGAVYSQLEDADGSDLDITVTYDLDASGLVGEFATCTVHVEYSDAATGGNWTEATSRSYTKGQNVTDEQLSLTATMLADYDLRLRLTYSDSSESGNATLTGHGEDGSPPGVQYSVEDATISEATMTPRSADELKFEGKEVSA